MKLTKLILQVLDRTVPSVAARRVYDVMSNPRVRKLRVFEEEVLDRSIRDQIDFKGFQIQTYHYHKK